MMMHMVLQNYCGNCGKRLSLNEEYCKGCGARTAFVDAGDDYMFTLPIYDIGFFDLDIDFSPYIESTRKDLKYEVCSCGYLNLKENDYCYHCGVKRTHSKLRRIFKSQPKLHFHLQPLAVNAGMLILKKTCFVKCVERN